MSKHLDQKVMKLFKENDPVMLLSTYWYNMLQMDDPKESLKEEFKKYQLDYARALALDNVQSDNNQLPRDFDYEHPQTDEFKFYKELQSAFLEQCLEQKSKIINAIYDASEFEALDNQFEVQLEEAFSTLVAKYTESYQKQYAQQINQ